ncbi:MAG: PAS-domain containing protein [Paracoccaceae bacterium]|nr:PAS-domain containing protein [Paracoccaceae bacterium]
MQVEWFQAVIIVVTSISSALLALMLLSVWTQRRAAPNSLSFPHPILEQTVFLFDDQNLVDATGPARALLDAAPMAASEWARLSAFIAPRFDGFSKAMSALAEHGYLELTARPGTDGRGKLKLVAEDVNGLARITLIDPEAEGRGILVDGLSQRALEDELDLLRHTLDRSPALVWREDADGILTWANRAYILRSGALEEAEETLVWPLPRLFNLDNRAALSGPRRMRLEGGDDKPAWFDCHSFPLESGALHFALPADATVRAEKALRDFVQTLTKTFADLPIGLAIFDRQRQLQLFNPALIDLLQLGPEFLSGRPTLYAFLDRLRETRMMPEPKDYRSWRLQMTELEQAAAAGFHSETWTLPTGQTYRVTGRPHPDGAVAFLFEDISSEVSLTRRFRAELEQGQEVLDLMTEAVAVFQPSGELTLSNSAYGQLWGVEPDTTLGRVTMMDAVRIWQSQCDASPIWAEARDFSNRVGARQMLSGTVSLLDGRMLNCRFLPLSGGAMMASFALLPNTDMAERPLHLGSDLRAMASTPR